MLTAVKLKDCRQCGREFVPFQPMQAVCGHVCATREVVAATKAKKAAERARDKIRKEALKSIADRIAEAQIEFNAYIRARDAGKPCICCGKPMLAQRPGGSIDAGHWISRGHAGHLRFNEDNCFAQRKSCNRPGGADRAMFRAGVVARIGEERALAVENDYRVHKWMHDELIEIRARYIAKRKELEAKE